MPRFRLFLVGLAAVLCGLASFGADPDSKEEAVKKDLKALQGEWQIKRLVVSDRDEDVKNVKESLVIKDAEYRIMVDGKMLESGTLKIDPTKLPRTMAFGKEGEAVAAIYELKGETLTLARHVDTKTSPTAFSGKDIVVLTCERKKP
jgi:uncharacterized protein (TIGR03067 family)